MSRVMESEKSEAPGQDQDAGFVRGAFAKIADRYVLTNHVLSAGDGHLVEEERGSFGARLGAEENFGCGDGDGGSGLGDAEGLSGG